MCCVPGCGCVDMTFVFEALIRGPTTLAKRSMLSSKVLSVSLEAVKQGALTNVCYQIYMFAVRFHSCKGTAEGLERG